MKSKSLAIALAIAAAAGAQTTESIDGTARSQAAQANQTANQAAQAAAKAASEVKEVSSVNATQSEAIEATAGKLSGLEEDYLETKATVNSLKKLKIGGLVQVRFNHNTDTGMISSAPYQQDYFMVRRGRIKATYDAGNGSMYVMQFDIKEKGLTTQDIYVKWSEPWLKTFSLQAGVQDIPYGYEIGYSSSTMEFLERSTFERNAMFKDEKDVGAILGITPKISALDDFEVKLAYLDGSGITGNSPGLPQDPACFIGRVHLGKDLVDAGVGLGFGASYFRDSRDVRNKGSFYMKVDGSTSPLKTVEPGKKVKAQLIGLDAQVTADMSMIPGLTGAKILGEMSTGTAVGSKGSNQRTISLADTLYQRDILGWSATYVQNIGKVLQTVVRYDVYDPNTSVSGDDLGMKGTSTSATDMGYNNWYFGVNWFATGNLKVTLGYDLIKNETSDNLASGNPHKNFKQEVKDDVLTAQGQFAF